jgi:hypothetical protein
VVPAVEWVVLLVAVPVARRVVRAVQAVLLLAAPDLT